MQNEENGALLYNIAKYNVLWNYIDKLTIVNNMSEFC